MKRTIFIKLLLLISLMHFTQGQSQSRSKLNFGTGWEFKKEGETLWQPISIPHTAHIENLVVVNQFQGVCYYQKKFKAEISDRQKMFFYFEGVMAQGEVFINNKKVLVHQGGYLPFTVDATPYLNLGSENLITVKVTNTDNLDIPPGKPLKDLDFNYYGGIYRNVYQIITNQLYITDPVHANKKASGGVFINFENVSSAKAEGTIKVHLKNDFSEPQKVYLKYRLTSKSGRKFELQSQKFSVKAGGDFEVTQHTSIVNPQLWSVNDPALYQLDIEVVAKDKIIDSYSEKIGIRQSEIRENGYFLNGEKIYINGTNRHQEYPYLGYAISDQAQYRDAVKIKNAGFDFVRLSHYPQAEAFLKACDELGILVMNSLPGWQFFGNAAFEENALQNLRDMVRRDRNHPSIVFWENSLNETDMPERFMEKADKILREEFPYANRISASWIDNAHYDLFIPARQHAKAPDYWNNYKNNNRKIFIAEYGDWEYYAQNAGFNQKDFANLKEEERTSRQLRGFGEKRLLQQAYNFQQASNSNRKGVQTIGEANWLMFDYNRGYSPDIESSGISDIFRIPKFSYYFYQSQRDADVVLSPNLVSGPMVYIANYWTENSPQEVRVFSNCDQVALYINEVLLEKKSPQTHPDSDRLQHPPFVFSLPKYQAGTLRAEGFIDGKKVAEHLVKSPQAAAKIELSYDLSGVPISKEGSDVIFVYAKITDANGTLIPNATDLVTFALEGADAEFIGQNPMPAEAGISTILLKTTKFEKPIRITASVANLPTAILSVQ
ncbi:glycoside hydrolase family 2 protein [Flavobacterium sp. CYK-4]|uniref:glycoside hydrolase family 2 TIM barrel-domain containing protein n=1 Tax=Flavobacterium lotistagni TaxID=2709660 RepID=UPI00140B6BA2|nr:glycoside hydrolase family 2 TIM barrel-domain containing protein [Flavobacterium lotistagni]NHM06615.1 glycoside hydrolase family 2 protein [Flavobacterium lotistagni]